MLASEYTAAHMAARLLAAISGLMLVRLLPVSEYGFYTLVLAAFTFICTFSDLGATETLSFFAGGVARKTNPGCRIFTPSCASGARCSCSVLFPARLISLYGAEYRRRHPGHPCRHCSHGAVCMVYHPVRHHFLCTQAGTAISSGIRCGTQQ